jgi:hypothetical protein
MRPASTRGGGMCLAFPDVCKVPAGPSSIPVPFPNIAQCSDASADTCTSRVKIKNKAVLHEGSEIPSTSGDEAGTLKGVVSGTTGDKAVYKSSVSKVLVEGNEIVTHLCDTAHNGSNANAPRGKQLSPSQSQVLVKP